MVVYRDPASSTSGLLAEVVPSLLLFAFLGPLASFYGLGSWIKYFRYKCLLRKISKGKPAFMSRKEAETLSEVDQFHFAKRYAESLIPLFLAAFYVTLFPLGALFAGAGAYFNHVITVWQWLTIYRKPPPLSPRIAKHFVHFMVLFPALMFVGAVVTFSFLPSFRPSIHIPMHLFF